MQKKIKNPGIESFDEKFAPPIPSQKNSTGSFRNFLIDNLYFTLQKNTLNATYKKFIFDFSAPELITIVSELVTVVADVDTSYDVVRRRIERLIESK